MAGFNLTSLENPTDGDDIIQGLATDDLIQGLAGNDIIAADAGNDTVEGGEGNDVMLGQDGDDLLIGDTGDDTVSGGNGDDLIVWNNGDGSDLMDGGTGEDRVQVNGAGADGSDVGDDFTIEANGDDVAFARQNLGLFQLDIRNTETLEVNGNGGSDTITGSEGLAGLIKLDLNGGDGDDSITGGDGEDEIYGDAGNDTLIGAKGDDMIKGKAGDDLIVWNNGDGSDLMDGGAGEDRVQVNGAGADGSDVGDDFTIEANGDDVAFARQNLGLFQLDIRNTETLEVNGNGGSDTITGSEGLAGLIKLDLNGGDGDDSITGGDGEDEIYGDAGNDTLIGAKGDDMIKGKAGDDLIVWNNGDGSDLMEGGAGDDRVQVNGADGLGDEFTIAANGDRVAFARQNLGPFQLDIGTVETLEVNGQAGDDVITGSEGLAGLINLVLDGGVGFDTITGGDGDDKLIGGGRNDILTGGKGEDIMNGGAGKDRMIWNQGDGSDTMNGGNGRDTAVVNGADGQADVFTIEASSNGIDFARTNFGQFTIDIKNTEILEINGRAGDDEISAGEGLADKAKLFLDGGAGDDTIRGSDGEDNIKGSLGDDVLIGNKGNDAVLGGSGDDLLIWNNGDGSDLMNGGSGEDRLQVNGADTAGDVFRISDAENGTAFERVNLGPFELDVRKVETLEVNGQGGDDEIIAEPGTQIALDLDGGQGADTITGGDADDLIASGANDGDSDLLTGGAGADTFVFEGDFGVDTILDFEKGDLIVIRGTVGEVTEADMVAALVQDGDDVVLETGADTLIFADTDLADFAQEDFNII